MSEVTPYINQHQNWGKDLLRRLNNLGDEDGTFNVWESIPTTGKDGEPLGEQHNGLTGIVKGEQTLIVKWDGSAWINLATIPVGHQGSPSPSYSIQVSGSFLSFLDPSHSTPFFFVFSWTGEEANFQVIKISKITNSVEWTLDIPTLYGAVTSFFSIPTSSKMYSAAAFFNSRLVFSVRYNDPPADRFYCVHESGYLMWTSNHQPPGNFRPANCFPGVLNDLYFVGQSSIIRISQNNGDLLSSASIPSFTYFAFGKYISSGSGKIFLLRAQSSASNGEILLLNSDLQGPIESVPISSGSPFITGSLQIHSFFFPDPQNDLIFYFGESSPLSGARRIWGFNAAQKSWMLIHEASLVKFTGALNSVKVSQDRKCVADFINGASIVQYEFSLDDNSIPPKFLKTLVPGGEGNIQWTQAFSSPATEDKLLQRSSALQTGYGLNTGSLVDLTLAFAGRQVVFFENASFLPTGNFQKILAQSTFGSLYAESVATPWVKSAHNISAPSFIPSHNQYFTQGAGVSVGEGGVHIMSCFSDIQVLSSIGYTGANRGQTVAGCFFNCAPISGNIISWYSHLNASSGVFLFDQRIGKFFWQVAPTQPQGIIPSFPDNRGVCLTTDNNLGVGTDTPAYKVDVNGTLRATALMNSGGTVTSDERIKVGILALDGSSLWEVCEELAAISFLYKPDFSVEIQETTKNEEGEDVVTTTTQYWQLPQGIQYGWSAQKIQKLLPELVTEDPQSGVLYLNREALFPIFQSAATAKIKQLEESIAQKDTLLTQLQSALESLTARVEALENAAA